MTFIAVPNAALALVQFQKGTETWSNGFWFTKNAFTAGDLADLADAVDGTIGLQSRYYLSNEASYVQTTAYDMRSVDGNKVDDYSNTGTGADMNSALPLNVALVITLRTAGRGRTARGRIYFAGTTENDITSGAWDADYVTATLDMLEDMKTACDALGWTWVVVSKYLNGAQRATPLTQPVTTWVSRSTSVGSQRRRVDRP